ncbi:site-specific DNA-methyltransferase [Nitrosopumilus sp.]|uniref:site-specific DNA-methyltransferase n=1 Tax=Nitrosopumilus sp. TaxID=2024843 RepID=UPI0034A04BEF
MAKKFTVNDVVCADSKTLSKFIEPNSVALTVTSPPYGNAINYSQHVKNQKSGKGKEYRGNVGGSLEDYLTEMQGIFSEVKKVTMPGGFCCIVIADELSEGVLIPLPSLLISKLVDLQDEEEGWHLRDMIIWNKVTAGRSGAGNRFGQFVKIPVPTRYRANIMHEYIIVLQKGKKGRFLLKETEPKVPLNRAMKRQVALSVWDITPVPPNVINHPAVFPEQIPWRLIQMYTKAGDVVLDPMCGSGQTVKVANHLKRKYIGVDIRKSYATLAKKRAKDNLMLSNFMIPLYFPVKWVDTVQSGKKGDAHIDVEDHVPKGFNLEFQKVSRDAEKETDTTHIYYKNKSGDYLCCVIGASQEPYMMKVGNPKKASSPLRKILKELPDTFDLVDVKKIIPDGIPDDPYSLVSLVDVLEHVKNVKRKTRSLTKVVYEKTK